LRECFWADFRRTLRLLSIGKSILKRLHAVRLKCNKMLLISIVDGRREESSYARCQQDLYKAESRRADISMKVISHAASLSLSGCQSQHATRVDSNLPEQAIHASKRKIIPEPVVSRHRHWTINDRASEMHGIDHRRKSQRGIQAVSILADNDRATDNG